MNFDVKDNISVIVSEVLVGEVENWNTLLSSSYNILEWKWDQKRGVWRLKPIGRISKQRNYWQAVPPKGWWATENSVKGGRRVRAAGKTQFLN